MLSLLFFLATDPGGNSWCDLTAHVFRASGSCAVPLASSPGMQTSGDPANTSSPSGPGLDRVHIVAHSPPPPFTQGFTRSFIQRVQWGPGSGTPERKALHVCRSDGEARTDAMTAQNIENRNRDPLEDILSIWEDLPAETGSTSWADLVARADGVLVGGGGIQSSGAG